MAWYDQLNQGTFGKTTMPQGNGISIDQLNAYMASQKPTKTTKEKSWLLDQLSTTGGIGGSLGGAALGTAILPGIGTLIGGALGGALGSGAGEMGENVISGEQDAWKNVGQEALLGGVTGVPIFGAAKGIAGAGKALLSGAGKTAANEALATALKVGAGSVAKGAAKGAVSSLAASTGKGLVTDVLGVKTGASQAAMTPLKQLLGGATKGVTSAVGKSLENKATTSLLKLTTSQTKKLLDQGIDPTDLAKIASRFGGSADDIIGTVGKGGPLQNTIRSLEAGIQGVVKTTGITNIRLSGDDIISALKKEAKTIAKELGGGERLKSINLIIKDAEKKYAKGITVGDALAKLRAANAKFGASVLDDAGDAVATAAQKLEANTLREALKSRFPTIANGLDDQSQLINLREILSRTRAVEKTGKFTASKLDLTRPGTLLDPLLNSRPVSRAILNRGTGAASGGVAGGIQAGTPSLMNQAARQFIPRQLLGQDQGTQPTTLENAMMQTQGQTYQPSQTAQTTQQQTQSPFGYSADQIGQALMLAYSAGDKASSTQLQQMYELAKSYETSAPKYSSTVATALTDVQSSLSELNKLSSAIQSGNGEVSPIVGTLRSLNPYDVDQKTLLAMIDKTRQIVGKALEGGVLRKEDEEKYRKILPTTSDTKEVALNKIAMIREQLQERMSNYSGLVGAGSQTDDLTSALLQAQGSY